MDIETVLVGVNIKRPNFSETCFESLVIFFENILFKEKKIKNKWGRSPKLVE